MDFLKFNVDDVTRGKLGQTGMGEVSDVIVKGKFFICSPSI